jgi:cell division transport system permease protein
MIIVRLSYFIRKAFSNIRAYPLVSFLSVVTISIALFVFSAYLLLYINLNDVLTSFGEDVHITAYLADFLSDEAKDGLMEEIGAIKEVEGVDYVSREKALEYLRGTFSGQGDVLEGLEENPLPASFEVMLKERFRTPEDVALVATKIERLNGVDDVVYAQEWLSRFYELIKFVKIGGVVIGVVLSMAVIAIIANTIKLVIYARKDEIEIMKLVGATNLFVKAPLVIEGMIQGLLGSVIAAGALYGLFRLFMENYYQQMGIFFGAVEIRFFEPVVLAYIVAGGVGLGIFGSLISLGRMLKV